MRIVQISDTHILCGGKTVGKNAEQVVAFVNEILQPDIVIHTGDVVGVDPDDDADRSAAVAVLAELKAPLLVVPGNHDVGSPGPEPWMGLGVTSERVAAHDRVFGAIPFVERAGGWGILGLNSELLGSGLPEEQSQWEWLDEELAAPGRLPLLVFMHRPMWSHRPSLPPDHNIIPISARDRLLGFPGATRIRGLGHGHLHWYRGVRRLNLLEVWCPATGFLGPVYEETPAFNQCGVVEWQIDKDHVTTRFRAPARLDERDPSDVPEFTGRVRLLASRTQRAVASARDMAP